MTLEGCLWQLAFAFLLRRYGWSAPIIARYGYYLLVRILFGYLESPNAIGTRAPLIRLSHRSLSSTKALPAEQSSERPCPPIDGPTDATWRPVLLVRRRTICGHRCKSPSRETTSHRDDISSSLIRHPCRGGAHRRAVHRLAVLIVP
jgi:hypothetical protein